MKNIDCVFIELCHIKKATLKLKNLNKSNKKSMLNPNDKEHTNTHILKSICF